MHNTGDELKGNEIDISGLKQIENARVYECTENKDDYEKIYIKATKMEIAIKIYEKINNKEPYDIVLGFQGSLIINEEDENGT